MIGNHDEENEAVLALPWAEPPVQQILIHVKGKPVFLNHYPMRSWPRVTKGGVQIHGHMHGRIPESAAQADVGVDCRDFRPVRLAELERAMRASAPRPARDSPAPAGRARPR